MIVVDTNIISYLYLRGERTEQAEMALLKDAEWVAPILWKSEFRNVLAQYMRKDLVSFGDALRIVDEAERLMEGMEFEVSSIEVLQLVEESACSAYDCEFVALARDLGVTLVTVDKKILKEFPMDAVSLEKFVAVDGWRQGADVS